MLFLVQNVNINFGEACLFALFSILVVFVILILITLIISLMAKLKLTDKKEVKQVVKPVEQPKVSRKQTKLEDIKDDDMMAAVLVATIDYANEIKEDVHLVSEREL
jgi:Na+-transporting methylmalonyl-CoA/oxaloacetate decarboxylase gamma subunit